MKSEVAEPEQDWAGMAVANLPKDTVLTSYSQAVAVSPDPSSKNTYTADLKRDWCIGVGQSTLSLKSRMPCLTHPTHVSQFLMEDTLRHSSHIQCQYISRPSDQSSINQI